MGMRKKELSAIVSEGWAGRRAASEKRRARKALHCKKWRACESYLDSLESMLKRRLSVKEYYEVKRAFGIEPQEQERPSLLALYLDLKKK